MKFELLSIPRLLCTSLAFLCLSAAPLSAEQFGLIEITDYPEGATGEVNIPSEIDGKPVSRIGDYAFYGCAGLTSVSIPDDLTYRVETSTDLRNWTTEGVMVTDFDQYDRRTASVNSDSSRRFLRLVVSFQ